MDKRALTALTGFRGCGGLGTLVTGTGGRAITRVGDRWVEAILQHGRAAPRRRATRIDRGKVCYGGRGMPGADKYRCEWKSSKK